LHGDSKAVLSDCETTARRIVKQFQSDGEATTTDCAMISKQYLRECKTTAMRLQDCNATAMRLQDCNDCNAIARLQNDCNAIARLQNDCNAIARLHNDCNAISKRLQSDSEVIVK
jgi:hypothetical protein